MARPRTLTDEERKARHRERCRRWSKEHPEKVREIKKRYYEKNKERYAKWMREWQKRNPDKIRENNRRWLEKHPNYFRELQKRKNEEK